MILVSNTRILATSIIWPIASLQRNISRATNLKSSLIFCTQTPWYKSLGMSRITYALFVNLSRNYISFTISVYNPRLSIMILARKEEKMFQSRRGYQPARAKISRVFYCLMKRPRWQHFSLSKHKKMPKLCFIYLVIYPLTLSIL